MSDPRIAKVAEILVDYSTEVKEDEVVEIYASEGAKPLFLAVYREVVRRNPKEIVCDIWFDEMEEIFFQEADDSQLDKFPSLNMYQTEHTDVWIGLGAYSNTRRLTSVDPRRLARRSKVRWPIVRERVRNTRWVGTVFPTEAVAQEADMSFSEFEDFYYRAVDIDWRELSRQQEEIRELFQKCREVTIKAEDTDITMKIEGRTVVSADGKRNMPDGEVFTAPLEDSVNGHIKYTYPAIYTGQFGSGREVDGVELWFEDGEVVKAKATKGEEFLLEMLATDEGAKRLGELGIGNNFAIDRFVKNVLFDEKIGGTVHLALGSSYIETGGKNESAIHWDMIKDLRCGGEIYLDGELIQKDGVWAYK
ncbi:MAG: aminopeptidase [Anaerolineae bacterium]